MAASIALSVYTNSDDAFIAWLPSEVIPKCNGFFLERTRRIGGQEIVEPVDNFVGYADKQGKSGEHHSSEVWPFQRFTWTDHVVDLGTEARYRVTAMMIGAGGKLKRGVSSDWSPWATLRGDVGDGFSCFFNRGLVISQFVSRYLDEHDMTPAALKQNLRDGVDPEFRAFLEGDLGMRLRQLITPSQNGGADLLAALYELEDEQLLKLLEEKPKLPHLVLANGSDSKDGNAVARARLKAKKVSVVDRLLKSKGLGHNKFLVLRNSQKQPVSVWTGSTNWATTGLCTQINNGLLIQNEDVAKVYQLQWKRLRAASPPKVDPAAFTPALLKGNDKPSTVKVGKATVNIWFTPTSDERDMTELRSLIAGATDSILFLMFQPGKDTGLHLDVRNRARDDGIYARGVVSTLIPGRPSQSNVLNELQVELVSGPTDEKPKKYRIVQPQGIEADLGPWIAEVTRAQFLQIGHAIVHSKLMVIDHTTDHPILVTGSHNFSEAASNHNDENFVIIRDHPELCAAYAANVMSVYQHYRYRSYVRDKIGHDENPWKGLVRTDKWMPSRLGRERTELEMWVRA